MGEQQRVEKSVKEVYEFKPPTKTYYSTEEAPREYKAQWKQFFTELGMPPTEFEGRDLLDAGCGSCEKATFYYDWGARVSGWDMTANVLSLGRDVIGDRDIKLVKGSLFDIPREEKYDIIISDGVLHCTYDTYQALRSLVLHLRPGGHVIFSLMNVYGVHWWFPVARFTTRMLGVGDFHRKARWGRRLFRWTRTRHEGTKTSARIFRSEDSWAYDWFANPRWNLHSPSEVRSWLEPLGLTHLGSIPSIVKKENPRTVLARSIRRTFGEGTRMLDTYWLANREINMMYIHARKRS